ncbi:MAG: hypothetical protein KDK70_24230, partial [Myxococcales bacterium]|nr:hypothetical protein [Myxococcales bacterium]
MEGFDGAPLFATPGEAAHSDRTRGHTAEQIFKIHFRSDVEGFDAYISDPKHQLFEEVELPPALQQISGEETSNRAAQVVELASDLVAFLHAISEQVSGPPQAQPLWIPASTAKDMRTQMLAGQEQLTAVFERLRRVADVLAPRRTGGAS